MKSNVEPYGKKFNYKPFIIPGALVLLIAIGSVFTLFDSEGERYQDLKTNEIQAKEQAGEIQGSNNVLIFAWTWGAIIIGVIVFFHVTKIMLY